MPLFYHKPMNLPVFKEVPTAPEPYWLRPDYLPHIEQARSFAGIEWLLESDIYDNQEAADYVFDVETYPNYFEVGFRHVASGRCAFFECYGKDSKLDNFNIGIISVILTRHKCVGFNSIHYDLPIIALAAKGATVAELYAASVDIIQNDIPWVKVLEERGCKLPKMRQHIDLKEVAPLHGSIKVYSGRLHCARMQDLPFPPETELTQDQVTCVRYYNLASDLPATAALYSSLRSQIELRDKMSLEYGIDLRSKSDAQIAEAVIRKEYFNHTGVEASAPKIEVGTKYKYIAPAWMQFQTPILQSVFETVKAADFVVAESGSIGMPPEISELNVELNGAVYRMSIGGLHSSEETQAIYKDDQCYLVDKDVTSYYPFIILNNNLYPEHLGPEFLTVFRSIVERRVAAKKAGDSKTANTLKIVINGTFGKLGSKYSVIYSPNLLIQVTVTGQLALLMLIEQLELGGVHVASANTDGIVIQCPYDKHDFLEASVKWWEQATGFAMESTYYSAVYSRDVNNYIAVKYEGGVKYKGAYANPFADKKNRSGWLQKNPTGSICIEAVENFLLRGKPLHETIAECTELEKFLFVRTVKGGGVRVGARTVPQHSSKDELIRMLGYIKHGQQWRVDGDRFGIKSVSTDYAYEMAKHELAKPGPTEYVGKTVRWYYATGMDGNFVYASNGNKVPNTDGAKPCLDLPAEFPTDIDYGWYLTEAKSILKDIGVNSET